MKNIFRQKLFWGGLLTLLSAAVIFILRITGNQSFGCIRTMEKAYIERDYAILADAVDIKSAQLLLGINDEMNSEKLSEENKKKAFADYSGLPETSLASLRIFEGNTFNIDSNNKSVECLFMINTEEGKIRLIPKTLNMINENGNFYINKQ